MVKEENRKTRGAQDGAEVAPRGVLSWNQGVNFRPREDRALLGQEWEMALTWTGKITGE